MRAALTLAHARAGSATEGLRSDGVGLLGVVGPRRWPARARAGEVHAVATEEESDPVTRRAARVARAQGAADLRLGVLCLERPQVRAADLEVLADGLPWAADPAVALVAMPVLGELSTEAGAHSTWARVASEGGRLVAIEAPEQEAGCASAFATRMRRETCDPAAVVVPWGLVGRGASSGALLGLLAALEREGEDGLARSPVYRPVRGLDPAEVVGLPCMVRAGEGALLSPLVRGTDGRPVFGALCSLGDRAGRDPVTRRVLARVREHLAREAAWLVFEHLHAELYAVAARTARTALERLWGQGLLGGSGRDEAYEVRCEADEQPRGAREAGQLVVHVRVRPRTSVRSVDLRLVLGG